MKSLKLYIDELGNSHPGNHSVSPYYILMGCVIDESNQADLKMYADHIKFKYWGKTDVVFHSVDMAKNARDFAIFRGKSNLKKEFQKDLLQFLRGSKVQLIVCLVDKAAVLARGWDERKVVDATAKSVLSSFLAKVKASSPSTGKVIFEISNGFKDKIYLENFNYLISPNFARRDSDYNFRDVQRTLTSINFVTKHNHDIETQISDILSYAARCKLKRDIEGVILAANSYEEKIVRVLENQLIRTPSTISASKKVFFDKINSFDIVS